MHVPHLSAPGLMDPADADSAVSTGAAVSMGMQVTPECGLGVLSECAVEVVCGCMLGRSLPLDVRVLLVTAALRWGHSRGGC